MLIKPDECLQAGLAYIKSLPRGTQIVFAMSGCWTGAVPESHAARELCRRMRPYNPKNFINDIADIFERLKRESRHANGRPLHLIEFHEAGAEKKHGTVALTVLQEAPVRPNPRNRPVSLPQPESNLQHLAK